MLYEVITVAISMFMLASGSAQAQAAKPNILVIWGDDIRITSYNVCYTKLLRIRKQVYELTTEDLERHPVWEFALDEEGEEGQDEATVRPYELQGTLDPAEGMFVITSYSIHYTKLYDSN